MGVIAGMASYAAAAAIVGFSTAMVIYQDALGLTPEQIGLASRGKLLSLSNLLWLLGSIVSAAIVVVVGGMG